MRLIKLLIVCTFFTGCSYFNPPPTPYQKHVSGKWLGPNGGYSDNQVQDNIYKVTFSGNGYTSIRFVRDMVLRRAAELTLEKNHNFFTVIDEKEDSHTYVYGSVNPNYGGYTGSYILPSVTLTIKMHDIESSDSSVIYFDAKKVLARWG